MYVCVAFFFLKAIYESERNPVTYVHYSIDDDDDDDDVNNIFDQVFNLV